MRFYEAGERSAGICETCRSKVQTRMEYRDYTPTGWSVTVPEVLVAACERCDNVVAVPHQSTFQINAFRDQEPHASKPIEARVPRALNELLGLVVYSLGGPPKQVVPSLIRYYLSQVTSSTEVAKAVCLRSDDSLAKGKKENRIAFRAPEKQYIDAYLAAKAVGIKSPGAMIRGLVLLVADDCKVERMGSNGLVLHTKQDEKSHERHEFVKNLVRIV